MALLLTIFTLLYPLLAVGDNYPLPEMDPNGFPSPNSGCLAPGKYHAGIEPIRAHNSGMAKQIYDRGRLMGDPNCCVVCHIGNPKEEKDAKIAHSGAPRDSQLEAFNRRSTAMGVNNKTCAMCHSKWVYATYRSVIQTEAGKIQGALWGWGPVSTGYQKRYGNYDIDDLDGPVPVFGTEAYKKFKLWMIQQFPQNFPENLERLSDVDLGTIKKNPAQAVCTYIRTECQRYHLGMRGRDKRGDIRGMGCAACHIPYSNECFYEGLDPTIPKDKKGHPLVHSIQASREAKSGERPQIWITAARRASAASTWRRQPRKREPGKPVRVLPATRKTKINQIFHLLSKR